MATLTIELPAQVTQGQMMQALESLGCELRLSRDGRNYTAVQKVKAAHPSPDEINHQAWIFRQLYKKTGGYVILFKGKPVAWKRFLDLPSDWEPGCIALDEDGKHWVAKGGSALDGADRWEAVTGEPTNVTRMPARIREVRLPGPGAA